jgi:N-acyl-D-aspartate/D-glutamate deacylase
MSSVDRKAEPSMADEAAYGTESSAPVARCDLLFRGGRVLAGTGAPGRIADVCVTGDRIVGIGDHSTPSAEQVIRLVMVNGQIVWRDGGAAGARPGRVLRRSGQAGIAG